MIYSYSQYFLRHLATEIDNGWLTKNLPNINSSYIEKNKKNLTMKTETVQFLQI